jgi:type IV pilus assembly protein PilB
MSLASEDELVQFLGEVPLFRRVREDLRRAIVQRLEPRFFNVDEVVFREGEPGDAMYVIRQGTVSVLLSEPDVGLTFEIARLRSGQVFGEMAVIDGAARSATVKAVEPTRCLFLGRETFLRIVEKLPDVAIAIAEMLAERVRQLNDERGVARVDLNKVPFDVEIARLAPLRLVEQHKMVPIALQAGVLTVACVNPQDLAGLDELRRVIRCVDVRTLAVGEAELKGFVERHLTRRAGDATRGQRAVRAPAIQWVADEGPIGPSDAQLGEKVKLLFDQIVAEAIEREASDIHVEPERDETVIRYRVAGRLERRASAIPKSLHRPLVSRIKILAELDISERRLPQDGRISLLAGGRAMDLRVSSLPTHDGEKLVLRILDSANAMQPIERLVLAEKVCRVVNQLVQRPHGVVYVCGPTGSGKTTTLYAALGVRRREDTNITTVEDPVEYSIPGVAQVSVKPEVGLTFASVLRSILRQDPNVILVGETRDRETGKLVLEAGLTGHMVLTSLHTNDAIGTIQRLREMELESFAIAASLVGVISQRLVRRLCPACATEGPLSPALLDQLALADVLPRDWSGAVKRPKGCEVCGGTGYRGRVGVFEILVADDALREAIARGATNLELKELAKRGAFVPMSRYSSYLLTNGVTSAEELITIHAGAGHA